MRTMILVVALGFLAGCSYPSYILKQAKGDISRSRALDSIEVSRELPKDSSKVKVVKDQTKQFFGALTITGGIVIGVCEIINVEHPSNGLNYTIGIVLPITLISAGIGICQNKR